MEAAGFACIREPRHRLMRRAIASIGGDTIELRLRNISSMGALVDCSRPVTPGDELTIDIVGVGPVQGVVRWAQTGKFGIQFAGQFNLGRLAPVKEKRSQAATPSPWHVGHREAI
jgi:hypothetical protein